MKPYLERKVKMQSTTARFLFGSLVGILLGVPTTHVIAELTGFGWWTLAISVPFFGTLGYLFYDIRGAVSGLKRAYRDVVRWQPDYQWWRLLGRFVMFNLGIASGVSFVLLVILFGVCFAVYLDGAPAVVVLTVMWWGTLFAGVLLPAVLLCVSLLMEDLADSDGILEGVADDLNLLSVLSWSAWLIWRSALGTYRAPPIARDLLVQTYHYIHSAERRAVFGTVALGIVIGFSVDLATGNVVIATAVGALLGVPLGLFLHRVVALRWVGIQPLNGNAH
ncbi:MAG: hypothetical protein WDZ79_01475 [Candidatus Paceibacterota bacterium]